VVAANATRSQIQIRIDGATAPVTTLETASARWAAVRRHDDLTITITARAISPSELDIEPIR
jgi:hypothetical protein